MSLQGHLNPGPGPSGELSNSISIYVLDFYIPSAFKLKEEKTTIALVYPSFRQNYLAQTVIHSIIKQNVGDTC